MINCSFCGNNFEEAESVHGCASCPMHRVCNKHKCPRCGYEIPKEPALIKFFKRRQVKKNG